jgi:hypothetical protein
MSAIPLHAVPFAIDFPSPDMKTIGARLARGARLASRGQSLSALRASSLRDRFYAWRGASGASYVCSVFSLAEEPTLDALAECVLIGVAREGAARRPLCVLASRDFAGEAGAALRDAARDQGLAEWHAHFFASAAAAEDLFAGLSGG